MPLCRRRRRPRASSSPWKRARSSWRFDRPLRKNWLAGDSACPTYAHACLCYRADILVHVEEVAGVVLRLDGGKAMVVAAVGGADAVFSLFHHEVDIGAAGAVGMQRVVVVPGPAGDERAVGLVWVHADDHLAPDGIAITERGIAVAHFVSRAVYRVKVHGGVHGGQLRGVLKMQRDGIVREFLDEVRLPVPLQSGRIEAVEHALQHGKRHGGEKLKRGAAVAAEGCKDLVGLLHGAGVAPDDAAHFLEVERFGEGRSGRHRQKCEEPVDFFRRLENELAIPLHDVGSLVQFPQHWSGANGVHGMSLKKKGRDHAEVATVKNAKNPLISSGAWRMN